MRESDKINGLKTLVEMELARTLKVLQEGRMTKEQIRAEQQIEIIKFINRLIPIYSKLENRDEIIASTLHRMGVQTEWGSKKLQEIAINKRIQEMNAQRGTRPTNSQGIEK